MKRTKRFAEGGFSKEQESWLGGADRTDPIILARMRKAVPDALAPVEDRKATPVADIKPAAEAASAPDMGAVQAEDGSMSKLRRNTETGDMYSPNEPITRSSSPAKAALLKAKSAGAGRGFVNPTSKDIAGAVKAKTTSTAPDAREMELETARLLKRDRAKNPAPAGKPQYRPDYGRTNGSAAASRVSNQDYAAAARTAYGAEPQEARNQGKPGTGPGAGFFDTMSGKSFDAEAAARRATGEAEADARTAARTAARDADTTQYEDRALKSGGAVKKMASGGKTGGRGDGIAQRGKTRGRMY